MAHGERSYQFFRQQLACRLRIMLDVIRKRHQTCFGVDSAAAVSEVAVLLQPPDGYVGVNG